ncbi:helix-turn-helix domain-containing protein [Mycolicibacterium goodii]|uniref:helix-turn-helix domain-containing protein n=1 Tax=Mycolicibacterium goodii TaxID=134601 RepID=UPI001BDDA112|nr:XRE family transcriptional regulator [Mycolicibacterium goodii]MBU8819659.1 XRE family transcriptional regulator [Mycolicibacterium goodii]MBU8833964.1 XRE family transcriptional regulator [Mycolicibacterium goodii]
MVPAPSHTTDHRNDRERMSILGRQLRAERQQRALSLEALAERSGVSRSMLSAIERGSKVPTVLVLDRIASALGVSVSRLLEEQRQGRVIELRRDEQPQVIDESGWRRSILSPVLPGVDLELGRIEFEPYADAGNFAPHQRGWAHYVAVEEGTLEITLNGADAHLLNPRDAVYYEADVVHAFRNAGATRVVAYILMIAYNG